MAIINLLEYKALADMMGDDSQDDRIEALIPMVEEDYLALRNKPFDVDDEGEYDYPTGAKMTMAEMISYKLDTIPGKVGVSTEATSKHSISYDFRKTRGYPINIVSKIQSYARAR